VINNNIIQQPVNLFKPATFLYLSQDRTWIYNGICRRSPFWCLVSEVIVHVVDIGEIVDNYLGTDHLT